MGDADHSITEGPMDASRIDSPEGYFERRENYIKHYYKEAAEQRKLRLECMKLIQALYPQGGISTERFLEESDKLFNYITNGGRS